MCLCLHVKMYRDEKTHVLQRMILFIEVFAKIKCFHFWTFINVCKFLIEMKEMKKYENSISTISNLYDATSIPKFFIKKKINISLFIYVFIYLC